LIKNNQKHHILVVIRWPVGGMRTFIRYVYRRFDPSRYKITILLPQYSEHEALIEDLKELKPEYIVLRPHFSILQFFVCLFRVLKNNRIDLIHSHGLTAGVLCALPARLSRTKHIMTSHDILLSKQFLGLKGLLKKKVLSILLSKIDVIHSVSNDAQNNLLEFVPRLKKRANRCVMIPNGIEIEHFQGDEKRDFHRELNLPKDTFLIGFLGRFMSQKGFVYLIEAVELLVKKTGIPKRPVVLAFGYGGFIREDRECIKIKDLEKYFHFLPFTPNVSPTLKGLDVVVMPSLWEACGLLAMEAMVAGVPLIGTECIGLREVIKGTPTVMIPVKNGAALAEALSNEINHPSKKRAEAFQKEAAQRFDIKEHTATHENIFLSLVGEK
jgi:glycosyltransferase involved in cell wall biosynthesis